MIKEGEIMSKKSNDYHERGIKAAMTRRQNEEHRLQEEAHKKMKKRGRKAGKTIAESELGYIDKLVKTQRLSRNQIFHHVGLPDLMVITNDGRLKFYEIKPGNGALKRKMLNPKQAESIKEALKNERVQEINLVRYTKLRSGKKVKYIYDSPIRLTKSNVDRYMLR